MTGPLGFDADRLDALVESMREAAVRIQAELDDLETAATKLRGSWSGEAQIAYDEAQREWTARMAALHAVLHGSAGAAEHAAHHYRSAEKAAVASWS